MSQRCGEREPAFVVEHRGFTVKAFYRPATDQKADIEVTRNGEMFNRYEYEAYRIWNIAAHFSDSVDQRLRDEDEAGHEIWPTSAGAELLHEEL